MITSRNGSRILAVLAIVLPATVTMVGAQQFTYSNKGDLLLGFRKTGANQANFEVVVNIGSITTFESLAPGASVAVTGYTPAQLGNAFQDLNNLQWSVSAAVPGISTWQGNPAGTLWYTRARTDIATQSTPVDRFAVSAQANVSTKMSSVGSGATTISSNLGTASENNTATLVREPTGDSSGLSAFIGFSQDATLGNFEYLPTNTENTTPASFTTAVRSDLYRAYPTTKTDPDTGLTSGAAYYVGYFELDPNGNLTFTRASGTVTPPAPTITIGRAGNISTVSFLSANNASYTLHYTDLAGLTTPVSTWQTGETLPGNGSTVSFQDTSPDANRVYAVSAQ